VSPPHPKADYKLLRGLIFDFDGALIDSELDLHLPAFNQAFADAGLQLGIASTANSRTIESALSGALA